MYVQFLLAGTEYERTNMYLIHCTTKNDWKSKTLLRLQPVFLSLKKWDQNDDNTMFLRFETQKPQTVCWSKKLIEIANCVLT